MLLTQSNLDYAYSEYQKQFEKTKKYISSRGGSHRLITMMNRSDFEVDFRSVVYEDPQKAQKKGWKAISRDLAKQDLYEVSWKQAERFARAHVDEFGGTFNVTLAQKYRMKTEDKIFDVIKKRRSELSGEGYSGGYIRSKISQEFFGS